MLINEASKNELISKSRSNARFKKRLRSRISSNNQTYNQIDMNKLFKEDIIEIIVPVQGETNDYEVTVSYEGVIEKLHDEIQANNGTLNLRCCVRALTKAMNQNDIYTHCTCPDYKYRMNYWSTIHHYEATIAELRPTYITNPNNDKGSVCKHTLLVLCNASWLMKVASVLNNYIKYMKLRQRNLYDKFIFPKLYDEEIPYDDNDFKQTTMFDEPEEQPVEEPTEDEVQDDKENDIENNGEEEDNTNIQDEE